MHIRLCGISQMAFLSKGSEVALTLRLVGRTLAQAVTRWLLTAAARVRVRAEHVGFVVDRVVLGQVFSEYFGFPCQSSFHQFLHHHDHPAWAQWSYWWTKWTQLDSNPLFELKKTVRLNYRYRDTLHF
jgi:hypothetical protein